MDEHWQKKEILEKLTGIIVQALRIDGATITAESRLFDDLGAESLDVLDIRFRIERAFGFKIEQDEIIRALGTGLTVPEIREKLTVQSIVDFVEHRLTTISK